MKIKKGRARIWETKIKCLLDHKEKKGKFDISSPMGIIIGFAIVIAAIMIGGGGIKAFKNFLDVSSILIVIGGTTATIVVAYRFGEIKK